MGAFVYLPRDSVKGLFALQILMQLAFGPTIPLLWAMMADVADYAEWKTGRRSTALAFASIVFGFKLGSGVGGWLNGELLHRAGYSGQGEQSAETLRTIARLISVFPAAALAIGCVVLSLLWHRSASGTTNRSDAPRATQRIARGFSARKDCRRAIESRFAARA